MRAFIVFATLILVGVAAYAAETITYKYDARGRLVQVNHAGRRASPTIRTCCR
jgi:YD repeat-containing protein